MVHRQNLWLRPLAEVEDYPTSPAIADQDKFASIDGLEFIFFLVVGGD